MLKGELSKWRQTIVGVCQESALGVILFMCNISVKPGTNTKMRRALNKQKNCMYHLALQFVIREIICCCQKETSSCHPNLP